MPGFLPIVKQLGYDPVWFGILFCANMQVSFQNPPFGPAAWRFIESLRIETPQDPSSRLSHHLQ